MTKIALDLGDGDDDNEANINTKNAYAEKYDNWRRREEIEKLKARVGDEEDSSSETSEEDVAEWTSNHERNFLQTLAALKTKDPKIYLKDQIFNSVPENTDSAPKYSEKAKSHTKPLYLKDYERKLILERGGIIDDDENGDDKAQASLPPTYYEQQEKLKNQLKRALENDDLPDELLTKKEKSASEIKKEEDDYYEWLKENGHENNAKFQELKGLKEIWHDDKKLNSEEKFLRDFLLERKYEIDSNPSTPYEDLGVITDDEEMEREQEFEHKFNFRFEEPDKDFIKQYPRTVSESLRKDDGKRKEKRLMRKQRKCAEKQAKKNEIRELKALKKKEIEAKLEKLKKLAGDELNVNIEDVEGDFDPVAYDRRMAELFNKEYYENADENEDKPSFSDDSDVSDEENLDFSNEQENKNDASESKVNHSAKGNGESSKGPTTRRKKRNAKFWNAVAKEKPLFDPNEKTFEEYYNEYYALDYEDILGDTITRFKYRNILKLDDKQLNAWASLKKVTAYRTDREEKYDIMAYAKKALDEEKKKRILNANYNKVKPEVDKQKAINQPEKPDIQKKENVPNNTQCIEEKAKNENLKKKKGCRRKKRKHDNGVAGVDDNRLLAYGVNPKKIRNKIKYGSSKVEKK